MEREERKWTGPPPLPHPPGLALGRPSSGPMEDLSFPCLPAANVGQFQWPVVGGGADPSSPGLIRRGQLYPFALSALCPGKRRELNIHGDCGMAFTTGSSESPRGWGGVPRLEGRWQALSR